MTDFGNSDYDFSGDESSIFSQDDREDDREDDRDDRDSATDTFVLQKLFYKCVKSYNWDIIKAFDIVLEFKNFIAIKKYLKDFDATVCSPSILIDQVWHIALLYTKEYSELCA